MTSDEEEDVQSDVDINEHPEGRVHLSDHVVLFRNKTLTEHGNVFEGEIISDVAHARHCAIKFPRLAEQMPREVAALLKLGCYSHVIALLASGTYRDSICEHSYIALEKCHEWNLRQYLLHRKQTLPVFDINWPLKFCQQIINGMTFIHDKLIIHKDLKPSNILLTQDLENIKIADFGSSQEVNTTSSMVYCSNMFGTLGFRPPESFGGSYISLKSDIFPLGALFYFLLSNGESPFGDVSDLWDHNARTAKVDLSGLKVSNPSVIKHLIRNMLSHTRQQRPTIEQIGSHPCWKGVQNILDFDYEFQDEEEDIRDVKEEEFKSVSPNLLYEQDDVLQATLEIYFARIKESGRWTKYTPAPALEDLNLPPPEDTSNDDITVKNLLCVGFNTNFYKGIWKNQTVCLEVCTGTDNEDVTFFARKLRALTDLRHRNIERLLAKTIDEPRCLVLEFVNGGHLDSHLRMRGSSLKFTDYLNFSSQVVNGMTYLSSKNYIHGSLCAESVMVTTDGVLKLTKIRLTHKVGEEVIEEWTKMLKVEWTAPEVLQSGQFSLKSDVWSFGVLLFEIFSNGLSPYGTASRGQIQRFLRSGYRLQRPIGCPQSIYDKMKECWEWDAEGRPEFLQLQKYLDELKTTGQRQG